LPPSGSFPYELLLSDSETGRLFRATDWSKTPLGPVEGWPRSLRIAVGICLGSRFPMFVWWGPRLVNIYNDAYIPVLGKRHPHAFGRPAQPTWKDIWPVVGPQADAVMKRGEATWNERVLLVMERHGYTEDTWFTWSYSPIPDDRGAIGGVFCACVEDTPRVHVERQRDALLKEIELERKRLVEVFAQSPSFLAVLRGPQHIFDFVNDRYLQLIGHRDLLGKPVREALPEIADQGFFEILDRVYATGEPFLGNATRLRLRRDAAAPLEEVYVDFVYQPVRAPDGHVTGILAQGVDITEERRAQLLVQESAARFRQLADAMPQIVFTAQPDGHVDYYNRRWYEYTGIRDADPAESWQEVVTEEWLKRVEKRWRDALESGEPYEIECPLRRHDGEYRWHLGRAVPIRDNDGRIVRWFGTNTDIHERKQFEQEIQAAHAEAERASRMKDEFLATLSHELRTPLNAILGWSQILKLKARLPDDLAQGVEVIERNARAQGRIIEDLLDMSAILSGKVRLEETRVDLVELARAAIDAARPTAAAKEIDLQASMDLPEAMVRGDVHRLQQVLWNLLSNAIKFTPPGGGVKVSLLHIDGFHELCVSDTGEGIPPEFLPFMFDRFRQADATQARRHGGLGLGLSIVRQLIELHGGTARAESAGPGRGSAFYIRLPVAPAPAAIMDATGRPAHAAASESEIDGLKVLVVDDDRDARDLVRRFLEECRAQVTTAGSAAEAAGLVQNGRYDVLVSDIGMPGEDGHALLRRIRALDAAHGGNIPAIALTAYARPEDRVKAVRAGFQMHLAKPVEPAELVAVVASVARRL
jgi:PAS domain S-box-containing protein